LCTGRGISTDCGQSHLGVIFWTGFLGHLKEAGATPDEACNYIQKFTDQRRNQETVELANAAQSGGGQPVAHPDANSSNPVDTATMIAWALLWAKVNHLQSSSLQATAGLSMSLSDELASLLGLSGAKGAIPASVLAKAPHLARLSDFMATDPHLEKTQELLSVYSPQSS
jgi:hypothetical protein